ncbi:coproporphyrinogen III oxidase [Fusobacterium polymorphum]
MLVYNFEILDEENVLVKSGIITYMFDSFKCLRTFDKLRIRKNKGLFYRGSTYIEKENIIKLKKIAFSWKELFSEASENFELTGLFNKKLDEYDRENYNKEEVIESLENLITLHEKAEKENKIIEH